MIQSYARVASIETVGPNIHVLSIHSPEIVPLVTPGQFINIKVNDGDQPFLRRPFSVYHTEGEILQIIFNAIGLGTTILSRKHVGDILDLIGPLGRPFETPEGFETAILVAGGLGVAPLPLLTSVLRKSGRSALTFLGARTGDQVVRRHLENVHIATDDGSEGFHGTVVDALRLLLKTGVPSNPKIFGCGPNAMLNSLAELAAEFQIPCEVSLESAMACGIGICQGCPIELIDGEKKYALVCKEGTVFDARKVRIQ